MKRIMALLIQHSVDVDKQLSIYARFFMFFSLKTCKNIQKIADFVE